MTAPSSVALACSALGSVLLAGVFLAAALPKLQSPRRFALTVVEYRVLPLPASLLFARLLPSLELLAALLLLAGITVRWSALFLALMLASFCLAVAINLARGRDVDCGCFGASGKKTGRRVGPSLLLQDVALLGVALVVCALAPGGLVLAPWSLLWLLDASASPAVVLLALFVGILAALAVTFALDRPKRVGGRRIARGQKNDSASATGVPDVRAAS